jgi:hypothetical protein
MMEVARALSSQKPGLSESCLSFSILARRFSTSKKPPYPGNAGPHIVQFFDCHAAKVKEMSEDYVSSLCGTIIFVASHTSGFGNSIQHFKRGFKKKQKRYK